MRTREWKCQNEIKDTYVETTHGRRFPQKLINIRGSLRESLLRYSCRVLFFCLTKRGPAAQRCGANEKSDTKSYRNASITATMATETKGGLLRFLRVNAKISIVSSLGDCTPAYITDAMYYVSTRATRQTGSISRSIENRLGIPE